MKKKPLPNKSDWSIELLEEYHRHIARIAHDYGLETYPNQIEIISAEQMMDTYSTIGMPLGYYHWSFGKQFVNIEKNYRRGFMGLAYEIVINSDPCIAYLLEENTMVIQATVIAHASYGHNSFFKNNYLFKTWTSADSIIDYLVFARKFISDCEERYGVDEVESLLDSCHALMSHGVDKYKRPQPISLQEEKARQKSRESYLQTQVNALWKTIPGFYEKSKKALSKEKKFPKEPEENILYFLEKNAPLLEPWQREIIRIVRKIARYFYPQKQTKVMNEGWATFWHYTIINTMYDEGLLTDEFMLEFLQNHTNLIIQSDFDNPYYQGINPYALGFAMFTDIRRIAEHPTAEDKQWFPELVNTPWQKTLDFAMRNFKDESFIAQYLSPEVIRKLKLFTLLDDDEKDHLIIDAIHDENGYQKVRLALSEMYNLSDSIPDIQVESVDIRKTRALILKHIQNKRRPLNQDTDEVLKHLHKLWGFQIKLEIYDPSGNRIDEIDP
jgi:stage V sporulation protein R